MKKYITSDKVGEFCQCLFNAGIEVLVHSDYASVHFADKSCQFVEICDKGSFESLVGYFISRDEELKKQLNIEEENSNS